MANPGEATEIVRERSSFTGYSLQVDGLSIGRNIIGFVCSCSSRRLRLPQIDFRLVWFAPAVTDTGLPQGRD